MASFSLGNRYNVIRILLADDNDRVRSMMREVITQSGEAWQICAEATDGEAAYKAAIEAKPDLVVLDFRMPVLNGLTAARIIRKALPEVPILLYTSLDFPPLARMARQAGINAVLQKVESGMLVQTIRKLAPS